MIDKKYSAPALEKGLDILELLAAEKRPLTKSQISSTLGRSISEIFRMLEVLQERGYITTAPSNGDGYELTNKMFSLGMSHGPNRNLLMSALPLMQELADKTKQSCHLAIAVDGFMVVIARVESPGNLGFSVRVGYTQPLAHSTSGVVLFAFARDKTREAWHKSILEHDGGTTWSDFEAKAMAAQKAGHIQLQSEFVDAVTDISYPVFNAVGILAALTMPHIHGKNSLSAKACADEVRATAKAISTGLGA